MTIRDILKYDGRAKEGKRALAKARLRLITATDEYLVEIAKLMGPPVTEKLEELKRDRAELKAKGIKASELTA